MPQSCGFSVTRLDWEKAKQRELVSRTYVDRISQCGPKRPASLKQQKFMRTLADRLDSTFTEADACCTRHAGYWITGALKSRSP